VRVCRLPVFWKEPTMMSAILYKLVDIIVGLRPTVEEEREGLDISDHGERAYNM